MLSGNVKMQKRLSLHSSIGKRFQVIINLLSDLRETTDDVLVFSNVRIPYRSLQKVLNKLNLKT